MNENYCIPQGMTYREREELKHFATRCGLQHDIQSLERTLIMIAHWMRQGQRISFTEYASQWTEAQKMRKDGNHSTPAMADAWPFSGKRCISPACSGYYPAGTDRTAQDDETEIRHAVTRILADYPDFNRDGLALHNQRESWQHPLDCPPFMPAAKSCLTWIRKSGLSRRQIKTFPAGNPTSYGLKHNVERVNARDCDETGKPRAPNYIPNGAMIAAMVASGYAIKPAGKMNAAFNISLKHLTAAIG